MSHRASFPPPLTNPAALAAHALMVTALRQPGACAGAPGASGLIETHLSSLVLAGAQVYKLKKPIVTGFVDFSTLEARHEACEQELRLNRRTAPRWYLAVVAVRQTASGARIALAGDSAVTQAPVLDWAVHMRRFDDSQRLDRLAQRGELTGDMIDQLAETVARFHAQQVPAPPGYGRSEATRHWARENLEELATLVQGDADQQAVAALQRWTEQRGAALASLMDLRCRTGHVREVHGDLHLGNVFWFDGAPVLFDALEFNDSLRHIDTLGDLAFCFMDLLAQGQPRLAWRFISNALGASGDWAALPLLAWWAVYRAAVRTKVALMGAAGLGAAGSGDAAQRLALDGQVQRYLAVAAGLAGLDQPEVGGSSGVAAATTARTAPSPANGLATTAATAAPTGLRLVLMFGLAGAGKSTVAAALAERLGAVRLRSDVERKRLFGATPTARTVPGLYTLDATRRTYERLQELAHEALGAGVSVVVDAASLRRIERDGMREVAAKHGAEFTLLVCTAPSAVLLERVQLRQRADNDASDATPEVLSFQQGVAEWPGDDEAADLLRLNTDLPRSALAVQTENLVLGMPT